MIIGQPGSGKSTLARVLGEITFLPVVHIDRIHWKPGWVERSRDEKTAMCHEVHMRDAWIFEGGHSVTWDERAARADMIIWLDFPLWLRAWRVTKRTLGSYGRSRPDLPEGCPERFNWEFTAWIWNTRHSGRQGGLRLFGQKQVGKIYHHLRSRRDVDAFVSGLQGAVAVGNLGIPHR